MANDMGVFSEMAEIINKPHFNVERHESGGSDHKEFKVRVSVLINESYFATRLSKADALVLAGRLTEVANGLPDSEEK